MSQKLRLKENLIEQKLFKVRNNLLPQKKKVKQILNQLKKLRKRK